ncbi:MAG: hypothetical protein A49_15970 [Methyloceanibacter sp.]|nr:MAG: hypothetical protein A49_15970 [Methyloceanibacter sp.]
MNQGYQTLTVRQKGGKIIAHRLHPKLYHYIQMYRTECLEKDDDFLFGGMTRNGISKAPEQPLSPQAVNYLVARYAKMAGIKQPVSCHSGRATAITQSLIKGAPLQVVSRAIGHSSIETTARYDRTKDRMEKAIVTFQDVQL